MYVFLFLSFYCLSISNLIYQGLLPTDENLFTDLPSFIMTLEKIEGFVDNNYNSKKDFISAGDLITSVQNYDVKDTTEFFKALDELDSGNIKIGFFDRGKLIQRSLFVPTKYLNRRLFDQLSSGVIVIQVEKGGTSHEAGISPGDIIISIEGKQFKNATEADILLLSSSSGEVSYYDVLRGTEKSI